MKIIKTPLPYYQFTREMLTIFVEHNIRGKTRDVFDYLCLHQNVRKGQIHPLDIKVIAEDLRMRARTVYVALAKLEKAGLYHPEKWGTIKGTLPYTQLANHSNRQARYEKRERAFYEELQKRIAVKSVGRTKPLPASVAYKLYEDLCADWGRKDRYYPKIKHTADLLNKLNQYIQPDTDELSE